MLTERERYALVEALKYALEHAEEINSLIAADREALRSAMSKISRRIVQ